MRKAIQTNFRNFFLFIFSLHLSVLFLHLQKKSTDPDGSTAPRIRILRDLEARQQIVESEDPVTDTIPKERVKLSDKNRAFDRETKARVVKSFQKSTVGNPGTEDVSLCARRRDRKRDPFQRAARLYAATKSGSKAQSGERSVSSTSDYLEDIPPGDLTHLNSVEYKFYGYYHRIKQKLEGFWGRSVQEKAQLLASKGRTIATDDDHVTALRIVMNSQGEIVAVIVLGSSGVKELDDAAIESFNAAGPFPNPPKDLIVDGRVTIEWGFVVNT